MIKELVKVANSLDAKGFLREADALDRIIRKTAFDATNFERDPWEPSPKIPLSKLQGVDDEQFDLVFSRIESDLLSLKSFLSSLVGIQTRNSANLVREILFLLEECQEKLADKKHYAVPDYLFNHISDSLKEFSESAPSDIIYNSIGFDQDLEELQITVTDEIRKNKN